MLSLPEGGVKCKRCKGLTVIVVDRGLHYIDCPDCHPSWAEHSAKVAERDAQPLATPPSSGTQSPPPDNADV